MTQKHLCAILLILLLPLMGCTEEPGDCSFDPCAPGCPSIATCDGDDDSDAGQRLQITCSDVDNIEKHWGGTSGPCGPESFITVTADGAVVRSIGSAELPADETECADPTVTNYTASPTNARALIDTICADFNLNHIVPGAMAQGSYRVWKFLQGETLLGSGDGDMIISADALDSFMSLLTPNPPAGSGDAGVVESGGDAGQ